MLHYICYPLSTVDECLHFITYTDLGKTRTYSYSSCMHKMLFLLLHQTFFYLVRLFYPAKTVLLKLKIYLENTDQQVEK